MNPAHFKVIVSCLEDRGLYLAEDSLCIKDLYVLRSQ